jgi:hypothetical protein
MREFKYDLAISLLDADLDVGRNVIYANLHEKFSIFLYSESQKDLAFREGVEKLSQVYRSESRAVLILNRPDWGTTKWTNVEKEAIKSRRYDEGAGFLMSVGMERMTMEDWIPRNFFYYEYQKWPSNVLIGAITGKLAELGAIVRELDAVGLARQHAERDAWDKEHSIKLSGPHAESHALSLRRELYYALQAKVDEIAQDTDREIQIEPSNHLGCLAINHSPCAIYIRPFEVRGNPPYRFRLAVSSIDGIVNSDMHTISGYTPRNRGEVMYAVDFDQHDNWFWTRIGEDEPVSTERLADDILKALLMRRDSVQRGDLTLERGDSNFFFLPYHGLRDKQF